MTVEMKKYKLGNIADFDKKTLSKKDSMDVIEYLDTGSLTENIFGPMQVLSRQDAPSRAQRRVFDKTILYSTVRPRLKHYGFMEKPKENTIVSTGFVTIDVKDEYKNVIDPYYLYLLLIQDKITEYLGTIADTAVSSYPSLNPSDIQMLEFEFPDLSIQKKIASVLYNIDKRVVNLRTQNRVLEQTAKTIYDYTFLQCAGHQTTYNKTLNRNIPVDWEVKKLGDLCSIFTGKKDVSKRIPGDYAFFSCAPEKLSSNEYLYDGQAILVSGNGSYTGRVSYYDGKFDLYQRTYACVLKNTSASVMPYLYFTMKYLFEPAYSGGTHGSAIPYIVMNDLTNYSICWNSPAIESFVQRVSPMFKKRLINLKQIEALIAQRNTLLPLLMTGQIEV
ncbi:MULTISPECIES: restriction endonuclease subunit S [unclassified Fibrobacter]|uniref:restriction endonuclease subunit S n=1 Tax=unclassified Fibrobacter TaxID=2634177 RepID=UPI0025C13522|nr:MULTISPECIES: restriction endonuclease subunit S [unclassified Fibrobacter]